MVRSVAGMINNCGIVKPVIHDDGTIDHAKTDLLCHQVYRIYRSTDPANDPHAAQALEFRQKASWPLIGDEQPGDPELTPPVKFMGLFDTVGSLGIPDFVGGIGLDWPQFHDQNVSTVVELVYHALSLHDNLYVFPPCLAKRNHHPGKPANFGITQKWFPGVHYDLGRQRFRFFRMFGGGRLERLLARSPWVSKVIQPNEVLSDLVLTWILEAVMTKDPGGQVIPFPRVSEEVIAAKDRIASGKKTGDGDVYQNILAYAPFGNPVVEILTFLYGTRWQTNEIYQLFFALRDRLVDLDSEVYNFTTVDESIPNSKGLTITELARITESRYPSQAYEGWRLRRTLLGPEKPTTDKPGRRSFRDVLVSESSSLTDRSDIFIQDTERRVVGSPLEKEVGQGQDFPHTPSQSDRESSRPKNDEDELMREVHGFPQPLQEALAPFIANEIFRMRIKDKYDEFERDKASLGKSIIGFLDMLGKLKDTEDESEDDFEEDDDLEGDNTTQTRKDFGPQDDSGEQGGSGTGNSGTGGSEAKDSSGNKDDSGTGNGSGAKKTPSKNGGADNEKDSCDFADEQVLHQDANFFRWTDFEQEKLPPKPDAMEERHKAILALYEGVKVGVEVLGIGVTLEGIAKMLRGLVHREDLFAFLRASERTILYPSAGSSKPDLDDLEKQLFDSGKFGGYDERLAVLTYTDGSNGSISLFKKWSGPDRIRPVAAMDDVPKIVLKGVCSYISKVNKTKLCFRDGGMKWTKGYLPEIEKPRFYSVSGQNQNGNNRRDEIGMGLKKALKLDPDSVEQRESFVATIPQMVGALHLGTSLLKEIESTRVERVGCFDQDANIIVPGRCVRMIRGPNPTGHKGGGRNVRIVVLLPGTAKWTKEKLTWK